MKVRQFLTPLLKVDLERLCRKRDLPVSGTVPELLERLARSYRGALVTVISDLRREDLVRIGRDLVGELDLPSGWQLLRVEELRRTFTAEVWGTDGPAGQGDVGEHFQLYSSGDLGAVGGVHRLDIYVLQQEAQSAKRTTVISAYYGTPTLKKVIGACRGDARVILNGLGGHRLKAQVKELEDLQEEFSARSRNVEIRLGFSDGVFHTKLYLFENVGKSVVWVGSANATSAGLLGHNEEVLARIVPAPLSVMAYAQGAWGRALRLEDCRAPVNSLTAFYRTGMLYYKPYALLQKTFNPFRRLMARLPTEERKKISAFRSEFAEVEVGIGAFSIDRVFERDPNREAPSETDVEQQDDQSDDAREERLLFRQYAVETCYGYWVSEKFVDTVDAKLERVARSKSVELQHLANWLDRRKEYIVDAYGTYLSTAMDTMDSRDVAWKEYADEARFVDTEPVRKLIGSLLVKLSDEKRLKLYCQAFVSSEVPEFWEDATATEAFESSFFESLAASSSSRRRPKAAVEILDAIGCSYAWEGEKIREMLKARLESPGCWYEEEFLQAET